MTKRVISSILWVQGNIPRNYNRQTTGNKTSEAAGLQVLPSLISRYPGYCDPVRSSASLSSTKYRCSHLANIHKKAASRQSLCFLFYILYFQLQSSETPYTFLYKSLCIRENSSSSSGPPVVISRSGMAFRPSAIGGCI